MGSTNLRTVHMLTPGAVRNLSVDGSTPVECTIAVPSGYGQYAIARLIGSVQDTGIFRAEHFGALGAALTNGLEMEHRSDGFVVDLFDGHKVKENVTWGHFCYDVQVVSWGPGDEFLLFRWTFEKYGKPLVLAGSDTLVMTISDDLTGLVDFNITAEGIVGP